VIGRLREAIAIARRRAPAEIKRDRRELETAIAAWPRSHAAEARSVT
jgi:hypothetical protein